MKQSHFSALDGLRGLAILLVIINHLPLTRFFTSLPSHLHRYQALIQSHGKTGIFILFILTGFLMARLYPSPASTIKFLTKRYSRLFPPFLVMVASFTFINLHDQMPVAKQVAVVLLSGVIGRIIWNLGMFVSSTHKVFKGFSRYVTVGWILIQFLTAIWYIFFLSRIPSSVFYINWKESTQTLITGVVNATLTLPFGKYLGQLDGVYWSLVFEVLFYPFTPSGLYPSLIILKI
jgi:peptidoglycan/LPS O-acetylase OafA/YrhL